MLLSLPSRKWLPQAYLHQFVVHHALKTAQPSSAHCSQLGKYGMDVVEQRDTLISSGPDACFFSLGYVAPQKVDRSLKNRTGGNSTLGRIAVKGIMYWSAVRG